jgi:hypothetical protein
MKNKTKQNKPIQNTKQTKTKQTNLFIHFVIRAGRGWG